MRRFMVHLVTDVDFVDGDKNSDPVVPGYEQHIATTVQEAANGLSLRTIRGSKVVSVQVGEIKVSL
jgi:hypothetical protein